MNGNATPTVGSLAKCHIRSWTYGPLEGCRDRCPPGSAYRGDPNRPRQPGRAASPPGVETDHCQVSTQVRGFGRPPVDRRPPRPALSRRHHLSAQLGGVPQPGGGDGCLQPTGSWLGDGHLRRELVLDGFPDRPPNMGTLRSALRPGGHSDAIAFTATADSFGCYSCAGPGASSHPGRHRHNPAPTSVGASVGILY
jgi:hypothetical protein